jgi:hypothetical protein
LWTDPPTDFRQAVGLMAEFCGLDNSSFFGQLQPVRNIVMDRAFPLAIGIAAVDTAICLHLYLRLLKRMVDFHEFMAPSFNPFFLGIDPLYLDKLE